MFLFKEKLIQLLVTSSVSLPICHVCLEAGTTHFRPAAVSFLAPQTSINLIICGSAKPPTPLNTAHSAPDETLTRTNQLQI